METKLHNTQFNIIDERDNSTAQTEETIQQYSWEIQLNSIDEETVEQYRRKTIQQHRRKRQFNSIDGRDNSTVQTEETI